MDFIALQWHHTQPHWSVGLTRYSHKCVNTMLCLGQFFTNDSSTFADFFSEFVSSCVTLGHDSRFPSVLLPHKHEHHLAFS